ncbi:hypothetical protein [Archangium sp.]|uniref:hypothetical protein n=1 Tax=Archangium sp. TaxID=1872627 RepID=UPI002D2BAEAD|nr:hypothetical protein [Archangium sp.]HYO55217.1 hypothetical protein [Archangium sp.]
MLRWRSALFYLLAVSLAACETADVNTRLDSSGAQPLVIEQDTSPKDLYFEVVRLHSAGLLDSSRMAALQTNLDEVDARYEGTEDHLEQLRQLLAATLRRTHRELVPPHIGSGSGGRRGGTG